MHIVGKDITSQTQIPPKEVSPENVKKYSGSVKTQNSIYAKRHKGGQEQYGLNE